MPYVSSLGPSSDGSSWPQRIQDLLAETGDVSRVLGDLARTSTTLLSAPVSCGITLRHDGTRLSVGSSDARAELLDEIQYRLGLGPCLLSLRTGELVEVGDAVTDSRWPTYLEQATAAGLRCSLSVPMSIGQETFGALNVYGFERPGLFGSEETRSLERFAAQAAVTLRLGARRAADAKLLEQMEEALRSRAEIDQALGIIMATQRCTSTAAFELLRRESQRSQRRLRDIAAHLIRSTSGQAPDPGRPFEA